MIVSAGEALIDLMPAAGPDGQQVFRAAIGGTPLNVALGLGRLGVPAGFLGAVSTDAFGDRIVAALRDSAVSTALVTRVDRPTPLAIVTLDGPEARYAFYDSGTAVRGMTLRELSSLPDDTTIFHFGSIVLAAEPAASSLIARARVARTERIVSFDPNVRPAFAPNEATYRRNLKQAMELAHIIKLSLSDLAWLWPGVSPDDFARERLDAGAKLVAVTRGADGAVAYTRSGLVEITADPVAVVDTIGAGDAFTAGLLAALVEAGVNRPAQLDTMTPDTLHRMLQFAVRVAALACTRAGADLPRRADLDAVA